MSWVQRRAVIAVILTSITVPLKLTVVTDLNNARSVLQSWASMRDKFHEQSQICNLFLPYLQVPLSSSSTKK